MSLGDATSQEMAQNQAKVEGLKDRLKKRADEEYISKDRDLTRYDVEDQIDSLISWFS